MNGVDPGWFQVLATVGGVVCAVFAAGWHLGGKINDLKITAATRHLETSKALVEVDTKLAHLEGKLAKEMRDEIVQAEKDHRSTYHGKCRSECQQR